MKDVVGRAIGVIDENGIVIASSELGKIGESRQRVKDELPYSQDTMVYDGYTYSFIDAQDKTDAIVFVEGDDAHAVKMCQLIAISLYNIKGLYDDKYDKGSFIKNIILDNILPSDIYVKSNELHFNTDDKRAVLVIKFQNAMGSAPYEIIESLVPDKSKDYVISISEQDIVVVKEVAEDAMGEDVEKFANALLKDISAEIGGAKLLIGVSSIVEDFALDAIRDGRVVRLPMEEEIPPRRIFIACLRHLPLSAAAKEMMDKLREVRLDEA
jgi:carbohydrate diacid regulator